MDLLQEYALHALYIYQSADPYISPITRTFFDLQRRTYPLLLPYLNAAAQWAHQSPTIVTLSVFVVLFFIALQVLSFVRRVLIFWMRLTAWLTFWAALVVMLSCIWQRGLARSLADLEVWAKEMSTIWWREYERWDGYRNQAQTQGQSRVVRRV